MTPSLAKFLPFHPPVILLWKNTLRQAAQAMDHHQIGSVLVADPERRISGVLTDRDLMVCLALEDLTPDDPLERAIRGPVYGVFDDAPLEEIVDLMREHGIRRVPIFQHAKEGRGRCLGVITLDDLIRAHLIDADDEDEIVRKQSLGDAPENEERRLKKFFHAIDRHEESSRRFLDTIAARTNLSPANVRSFTLQVLGALLKRSGPEGGRKLLAQLPTSLQMELLAQSFTPDPVLTADQLIRQIGRRYDVAPDEAEDLLRRFFEAVGERVSHGSVHQLADRLPPDLRRLFPEDRHP